jgi:hypothetical protein
VDPAQVAVGQAAALPDEGRQLGAVQVLSPRDEAGIGVAVPHRPVETDFHAAPDSTRTNAAPATTQASQASALTPGPTRPAYLAARLP